MLCRHIEWTRPCRKQETELNGKLFLLTKVLVINVDQYYSGLFAASQTLSILYLQAPNLQLTARFFLCSFDKIFTTSDSSQYLESFRGEKGGGSVGSGVVFGFTGIAGNFGNGKGNFNRAPNIPATFTMVEALRTRRTKIILNVTIFVESCFY